MLAHELADVGAIGVAIGLGDDKAAAKHEGEVELEHVNIKGYGVGEHDDIIGTYIRENKGSIKEGKVKWRFCLLPSMHHHCCPQIPGATHRRQSSRACHTADPAGDGVHAQRPWAGLWSLR